MTMQNMFGVVLWSDTAAQKAVIWCEDQGELAFYTPGDCIHEGPSLDAGDLIQFDISIQENIRKAVNPQLLMQSHSPDLPQNLKASHSKSLGKTANATRPGSQNVVDLTQYFGQVQSQREIAITG